MRHELTILKIGNGDWAYNRGSKFKNIAKGTTDPRVEFILPKTLLEVISNTNETQIMITFHLQNLD